MNIGKWERKPLKKELNDIIKLQEERISELNKEMMKLNVVIRNQKPIRIDTRGLDYMVDLEQKYFVLQDIIKEVREINKYIYSNLENIDYGEVKCKINRTLEMLDKGGNSNE
ncbi:MAG: hypothetical protein IJI98_11120 [Methanosphaera sp.]|nr:hypothetical protein [Methanobrevibacter sp.]MBQ6754211.1 hypothetical protein [Bacteroidales bacterium]MBR0351346.1 hypothetical protein [Clostridia bacterium]MBR0473230.1 hypothetical protein [Methanosphaera sp.]